MKRVSIRISYIAIFSGLALLMSLSGISKLLIYPPVPYLKFDPAEIFDMMAYFIGGLEVALITTFIHFIGLALIGGDIIGPGMKLLAVLSMILGYHLGVKISDKYIVHLGLSTITRVFIMSLANIYVLVILAPGFLEIFTIYNTLFFISLSGLELLMIALILTGVYNVIHNIFSIGIAKTLAQYTKNVFRSRL